MYINYQYFFCYEICWRIFKMTLRKMRNEPLKVLLKIARNEGRFQSCPFPARRRKSASERESKGKVTVIGARFGGTGKRAYGHDRTLPFAEIGYSVDIRIHLYNVFMYICTLYRAIIIITSCPAWVIVFSFFFSLRNTGAAKGRSNAQFRYR